MQNKNKIQEFHNTEFGDIRIVEIGGQPWFIGKDICAALGYGNCSRDINRHVDPEDRQNYRNGTFEMSNRGVTIINESGLYSLILSSKLPSAKRFKRWVTSEVLPLIRKYDAYITTEKLEDILRDRRRMDKLLYDLKLEREESVKLKAENILLAEEKNVLVEIAGEMMPKAMYHDLILQCEDAIPITLIAKDYGLSAQTFNKILYAFGIQYKVRGTWLLYQAHAGKGYTITQTRLEGKRTSVMHTYWTQKGRLFLYEFLKSHNILPEVEIEFAVA